MTFRQWLILRRPVVLNLHLCGRISIQKYSFVECSTWTSILVQVNAGYIAVAVTYCAPLL